MDTIFMNSQNTKTSDSHRILLSLSDNIDLKRSNKFVLAYTIHGKIWKKSCKNNKFKISAPTSDKRFELPHRSYSVSDIQDYFEYIIK